MPTYEFRCPSGHDFEKFYRSIGAAPPEVACPTCGKVASRQLSAGGGLLFKGSGFYITDYGKDGKKPLGAPSGRDKPEVGSSGESAASKPDSSSSAEKSSSPGSEGASSPAKPAVESKPPSAAKKPKASE